MRKLGLVLGCLLSAALLLALAPPTAAQDDCNLTLSEGEGNDAMDPFAVEESRSFTFVVENPGNLDARGTFRVLQDPPEGWDWSTQDRSMQVPAGESVELSLSVVYLGERDLDAELSARVEEVRCSALGIDSPQTTQTQTVSFALTHEPLPTDGAGDDLPWAWIVFGAIVAGTVVGVPVAYRSRSARIDATCEEAEKDVVAGRGTSFPVTLKSKSSDPIPVKLEVADVQEGWSALTTLPDLELGPKETRTVYLMVRAPPDAKPGDLCVAKLNVKVEGGSSTTVKTLTRVSETAPESEEPAEEGSAETDEG